jgi:Uma2 family endonuclease
MQKPHPPPPPFTYEDYVGLPDDGNRHEILEGEHNVTPAPSPSHQVVVVRLLHYFQLQVSSGFVYTAPIDVLLTPSTVVQPDVCYLGEEKLSLVTRRGIEGAPDIVVEVLSPSSARVDEGAKRRIYAKYGVGEYWLVDTERGAVRVFAWSEAGSVWAAERLLTARDRLTSPLAPGLDVAVAELFAPPSLRRG